MPNRKGDPDVRPNQAIRVDPVRPSRCGLHRHRRLPRRRRLDPSLLRHRGTRRTGLQLRAAEVAHFKNDPVGRMRTLAKEPGRENVEAVSADLVAMPEATQPADVLWLHLFYHDLHTTLIQAKGATAAHFNRAVYERLKPGGSYVIVDHAAAAGAGTSDAQSLHRIEPASVRAGGGAAGLVLDAETTLLANKDG